MANFKQVYKCDLCGNVVELLHSGAGTLVCCGQPMTLQKDNTIDAAKEKHIPVIDKILLDPQYINWRSTLNG